MGGSLAIRSMLALGRFPVHYVDLGDQPLTTPDPAIAMRTIDGGGIAILPAKAMCLGSCSDVDGTEKFGVIIESRALREMAARANVAVPTLDTRFKDGVTDAVMRGVMDALRDEIRSGGLASSMYTDALLAQLIVCVFRAFDAPANVPALPVYDPLAPSENVRLERAVRYIEEHLGAQIVVDDIARAVDLSPFHFSRAFKRWTGESPHRFLLRARLDRAQRMVIDSQLSLGAIALAVGFYDQSHFGTHFKRAFGATPRQMRQGAIDRSRNIPVR